MEGSKHPVQQKYNTYYMLCVQRFHQHAHQYALVLLTNILPIYTVGQSKPFSSQIIYSPISLGFQSVCISYDDEIALLNPKEIYIYHIHHTAEVS